MAKDVVRRVKNYQRKLDVEHIAKQLEAAKEQMLERNAQAQIALDDVEQRTRAILGECSIPTIDYIKYLNFSRQLWKLHNNFSGGTLRTESEIQMFKWSKRGADPDLLERIAFDVFSIEKPAVQAAKDIKEKAAMKK